MRGERDSRASADNGRENFKNIYNMPIIVIRIKKYTTHYFPNFQKNVWWLRNSGLFNSLFLLDFILLVDQVFLLF